MKRLTENYKAGYRDAQAWLNGGRVICPSDRGPWGWTSDPGKQQANEQWRAGWDAAIADGGSNR